MPKPPYEPYEPPNEEEQAYLDSVAEMFGQELTSFDEVRLLEGYRRRTAKKRWGPPAKKLERKKRF